MKERILDYLINQGLSEATICDLLGWNRNKLNDLKRNKSSFSVEDIVNISEKFQISIDYLITGKERMPSELTPEQKEWLSLLDKLDPIKQAEFKGELKGYIKAKEEK